MEPPVATSATVDAQPSVEVTCPGAAVTSIRALLLFRPQLRSDVVLNSLIQLTYFDAIVLGRETVQ